MEPLAIMERAALTATAWGAENRGFDIDGGHWRQNFGERAAHGDRSQGGPDRVRAWGTRQRLTNPCITGAEAGIQVSV
jgi:hypothetical protein